MIGDEQATLLKIDVKSGAQGCEFLFYTRHAWQREFLIKEGIVVEISFWTKFPSNFFLNLAEQWQTHIFNKLLSFKHFLINKKKMVYAHLFDYFSFFCLLWLLWSGEGGMETIVFMRFRIWHVFSKKDKLDHWKMSQE